MIIETKDTANELWWRWEGIQKFLTDSSSSSTASIIGHIIAMAAVLEIHMDTNIVTAIRPKFNLTKNEMPLQVNSLFSAVSKSLVHVPSLTAADDRDHLESHTLMQIAMLYGQRNNETAYEHQHCVFHVHHACFVRFLMKLNKINCFVPILSLHSCTLTNIPSNGNSTIGSIDVIAVE